MACYSNITSEMEEKARFTWSAGDGRDVLLLVSAHLHCLLLQSSVLHCRHGTISRAPLCSSPFISFLQNCVLKRACPCVSYTTHRAPAVTSSVKSFDAKRWMGGAVSEERKEEEGRNTNWLQEDSVCGLSDTPKAK